MDLGCFEKAIQILTLFLALSFAPWMFAVCLFFYLAHQYGKHESPDERMVRKWKQGKIKRRKRRVVPAKETSLALDFEKVEEWNALA